MADSTPKSYHTDPTLYLYTSLTSGSSHIITATSRLETILKANRIQFQALDVATDEKARMLWGRRAGKRKLPGLVRMGMIVADLEEVEEWNEYGEIKDNLSFSTQPASATNTPSKPRSAAPASTPSTTSPSKLSTETQPSLSSPSQPPTPAIPSSASADNPITAQMRQLGIEAARKASDAKTTPKTSAPGPSDVNSETLQKFDNAGSTGMPPPSGTTEAEAAKAPETANANVASKADEKLTVEEFIEEESKEGGGQEVGVEETGKGGNAEIEHPHGTLEPAVAAVGQTEDECEKEGKRRALEEHGGLEARTLDPKRTAKGTQNEYDEAADEEVRAETANAVTTSADTTTDLPGKKTQDQGAGEGEEAGVSVGD